MHWYSFVSTGQVRDFGSKVLIGTMSRVCLRDVIELYEDQVRKTIQQVQCVKLKVLCVLYGLIFVPEA